MSRALGVPGGRATKIWQISAKKLMLTGAKLRRWAEIVAAGTPEGSQATSPGDAENPEAGGSWAGSAPRDPAAQWAQNGGPDNSAAAAAFLGTESYASGNAATDGWWSMWGNDVFAGLDNNSVWFQEPGLDWAPQSSQPESRR